MLKYKCPTCGKVYYPEKDEICPRCGDAAAASVLTRIERKRSALWLRSEGNHHFDDRCHDDDAWSQSYGAGTHRAAVRSHEAALRAGYAAHQAVDNPTQVSNANPTRVANAKQAAARSKRGKSGRGKYAWIGVAWLIYVLFRLFQEIAS